MLLLEQYRAAEDAYDKLAPLAAAPGIEDESRRFVKQQVHVVARLVGKLSGIVTYVAMGAGMLAMIGGLI